MHRKCWRIHPKYNRSPKEYFLRKIEGAFAKENHYELVLMEETLAELLYETIESRKKAKYTEWTQFREDEEIFHELLFLVREKIYHLEMNYETKEEKLIV